MPTYANGFVRTNANPYMTGNDIRLADLVAQSANNAYSNSAANARASLADTVREAGNTQRYTLGVENAANRAYPQQILDAQNEAEYWRQNGDMDSMNAALGRVSRLRQEWQQAVQTGTFNPSEGLNGLGVMIRNKYYAPGSTTWQAIFGQQPSK